MSENKPERSLHELVEQDLELKKDLEALGIQPEEIPHYLNLLYDYELQMEACRKCKGLSDCEARYEHMGIEWVILDSGKLGRNLVPCRYAAKREAREEHYLYHDFPDEWLDVELASITGKRRDDIKRIFDAKFLKNQNEDRGSWIYIHGEGESGKSYLTVALMNRIAQGNVRIAFINTPKRLEELKGLAIKNPSVFAKRMDELARIPFLVMDDFGLEYKSDYVRDTILYPLLKERSSHKKRTVFLSPYSLNDLTNLYLASSRAKTEARKIVDLIERNIKTDHEILPSVTRYSSK